MKTRRGRFYTNSSPSCYWAILILLHFPFVSQAQFPVHSRPKMGDAPVIERKPLLRLPKLFQRPPQNPSTDTPHPAIVRVECQGNGSIARGSGTLIGVDEEHGYIISNWHVVNEATGPITVAFPDGFQSAATVINTDEQWDLALLAIWSPPTQPMPLSARLPEPGDPLIIAGYGQGPFKAVLGKCTDYVSPSANAPFEMIEVTAPARQGDSGGPIINQAGELAGVLFGSGNGRTTGSHVGRLREFLNASFENRPADGPPANAMANVSSSIPLGVPGSMSGGPIPGQAMQSGGHLPTPSGTPLPTPYSPQADPLGDIDLEALTAGLPEGPNDFSSPQPGYDPYRYGRPNPTNPLLPFFVVVGGVALMLFLIPRN